MCGVGIGELIARGIVRENRDKYFVTVERADEHKSFELYLSISPIGVFTVNNGPKNGLPISSDEVEKLILSLSELEKYSR